MKYKKTCVICGKKFETDRYNKSVCSDGHYKQCKVCGKQFELKWPYTAVTCSSACRGVYRKLSGVGSEAAEKAKQTKLSKYGTASNTTMLTKICKYCGKEFETTSNRRVYCYDKHYGACPACGKLVEIHDMSKGPSACSNECRQKLIEKTNIEKYGSSCVFQNAEIKDKIKETNLEKYGVDHYSKTDEYKAKTAKTVNERFGEAGLSNKATRQKKIQTSLDRYGTEYPNQSDCVKKKIKQTMYANHGGFPFESSSDVNQEIKQTMINKYGCENPMNVPEIVEKMKKTNLERYGTTSSLENPYIQEMIRAKNLQNLGVEYPFQSASIQEKSHETVFQRYGVNNVFQSANIKEKIRDTNLSRYSVANPMMNLEIQRKAQNSTELRYGKPFYHQSDDGIAHLMKDPSKLAEFLKFRNDVENYLENNRSLTLHELSNRLGVTESTVSMYVIRNNCNNLIRYSKSNMEDEVVRFIHSFSDDVIVRRNVRDVLASYELDIYLPDKQFAIECNPTVTHNSSFKDPWGQDPKHYMYHKKKSDLCEDNGIQLFHIFGYEWVNKKEIIQSMIANDLGFTSSKLYARNTETCKITSDECKQFLNRNHRQGNTFASIRLGLRDKKSNELVSVMTFNKVRSTIGKTAKFDGYELSRFCSKLNTSVVGGASKLFKYFTTCYPDVDVVSFSDKAHTSGKLYEILGFDKVNESTPSYVWVNMKDDTYYNRVNCQKKNLRKLFHDNSIDVENKTEKQIMEEHGYARVFDSGTIRWEYTNTNKSL